MTVAGLIAKLSDADMFLRDELLLQGHDGPWYTADPDVLERLGYCKVLTERDLTDDERAETFLAKSGKMVVVSLELIPTRAVANA
jgi:hypothetical protein